MGSTATVSYVYDALNRVTDCKINGSANDDTWAYDAMNRIIGSSNLLGAIGYQYVDDANALGSGNDKGTPRLSSMTLPTSQKTTYSYLPSTGAGDERLSEIKNLNPSSVVLSQFDYTYDAKGQIATWKQQVDTNPFTQYNIGYDAAGQVNSDVLTDSTSAVIKQYYYNYDAAGNRTSEQIDGSVTATTVNNMNQVTGISAGGATRFQGTITQPGTVTVNGQAASMQPTATNFIANPVLSGGTNVVAVVARNGNNVAQTNNYQVVIPAVTAVTPTYDADGNVTSSGAGQTYTWDQENRLITITYTGGATSNFTYDALGRRVKIVEKNSGGTVTSTKQHVWTGATIAEERDGSNTITKSFFSQGVKIGSSYYFYTKDHLGSIREVTDASGVVQARYDYDPYGRVTLVSGSNLADFQYAGYYEHATSGLNLTLFRAYDPNTGKWLSRDPLAEMGGINLYAYAHNNSIARLDPYGLCDDNDLPKDLIKEYITMKHSLELLEALNAEDPLAEIAIIIGQAIAIDLGFDVGETVLDQADHAAISAINSAIQTAADHQNATDPFPAMDAATALDVDSTGGMADPGDIYLQNLGR